MPIPKIIHHVWIGTDPFRFPTWRRTWFAHNPDWSFMFHREPPPGSYEDTIKICSDPKIPYVIKSDLVRWEVLRIYGGIYTDTDIECLKSFEDIISIPENNFTSMGGEKGIVQAIMGSVPDSEWVKEAIKDITQRVLTASSNNSINDVMMNSGPTGLKDHLAKAEKIYSADYFMYGRMYSKHYWSNRLPGGWSWVAINDNQEPVTI